MRFFLEKMLLQKPGLRKRAEKIDRTSYGGQGKTVIKGELCRTLGGDAGRLSLFFCFSAFSV